jgi:hypothetical protein
MGNPGTNPIILLYRGFGFLSPIIADDWSNRYEEKPFTSSVYRFIQKPAVERGGGGRSNVSPRTTTHFPSRSLDISFTDVVTVILLLDGSFMGQTSDGSRSAKFW